jgi:hypothetical protein
MWRTRFPFISWTSSGVESWFGIKRRNDKMRKFPRRPLAPIIVSSFDATRMRVNDFCALPSEHLAFKSHRPAFCFTSHTSLLPARLDCLSTTNSQSTWAKNGEFSARSCYVKLLQRFVGRKKRDEEELEVRSSSWNSNLCLETLSDLSGQRSSDEGI